MRKAKTTKRALLLSALSLLMCVSMLVGSTFAWFTDSVTSGRNKIVAGNLDVVLEYKTDWADAWKPVDKNTKLFKEGALYEPGYTEIVYLRVSNAGSLALKYNLMVDITDEKTSTNVLEETFKLSDYLEIGTYCQDEYNYGFNYADILFPAMFGTRAAAIDSINSASGSGFAKLSTADSVVKSNGPVLAGDKTAQVMALVLTMPETVGNEANHKTGVAAPEVELGVSLVATQYTDEKDSFGSDYDANAAYPVVPVDVYTANDFNKVKDGAIINLCADISLSEAVMLPANAVLRGNGHQINGSIYAGGDLTISGHVKITDFSATYYDRTITIGEGSCLEITGTGRMTLGYGNVFNITGTLENAKNADKNNVQPSLIVPGGISITGGDDAAMNITNAYVKIGSTTSKNSAANGTFTLNFTNTIAEFTNQLTLAEPTNGKNPTFNINIKDSVLTTGTKFVVAAPNSNVVIDNSSVTLATYFRNSGSMLLKNGSVLTGATIQFGENGGNNGTTTVDGSTFTITASSVGHALDGKNTGKLVLKNGATASVDYYKALAVEKDATSSMTGTEVN